MNGSWRILSGKWVCSCKAILQHNNCIKQPPTTTIQYILTKCKVLQSYCNYFNTVGNCWRLEKCQGTNIGSLQGTRWQGEVTWLLAVSSNFQLQKHSILRFTIIPHTLIQFQRVHYSTILLPSGSLLQMSPSSSGLMSGIPWQITSFTDLLM